MAKSNRTQRTFSDIERGLEVGSAGLTLLERIIAMFRPKPAEERAAKLRDTAEQKRETAAKTRFPRRRKRLLKQAGELEDKADELSPVLPLEPPRAFADASSGSESQDA